MSFYVPTVDGWFGKHTVSPIQQKTHWRLLALCWRLCVRKGLAACAGITLGGGGAVWVGAESEGRLGSDAASDIRHLLQLACGKKSLYDFNIFFYLTFD
jgi:hypothetical protein